MFSIVPLLKLKMEQGLRHGRGVWVMQGISTFSISNFSKPPTPSLLTSFTAMVAKAAKERRGLNPRYLLQPLEILPVELTGTYEVCEDGSINVDFKQIIQQRPLGKMRELLTFVLILSISSTCLCRGLVEDTSGGFNVLDYGAVGDGQTDDSQAFSKAWTALCQTKGTPQLIIPSGKKFLLMPVMFQGPCQSNSVQVQILRTILAPNSMDGWTNCSANCWLRFSGVSNLIVSGSGTIDGRGSTWWNQVYNGQALQFNYCNNLQLSGLTHLNSPKNHISLTACNGASLSNLHLSAPASSPNTDGIDISSSTNINIHDSNIATGDDCIAINGNSAHINITGINCGPGHGISVGSLGANGAYATVEEVYVNNCSFNRTLNGARIKTWQGGSGYARNIFFEQITLVDVKNPIIVDQFYCNGKHDCKNELQKRRGKYRMHHTGSALPNWLTIDECDNRK
ncbi:hypothetical protein SO802_012992 [Lithocarpus litseifolius]|uniref:Polygalacturonase n=1 Tax=Lithocarpus litseifolius TaxID=425828 RepID=A0AAW2D8D5_9ROSI